MSVEMSPSSEWEVRLNRLEKRERLWRVVATVLAGMIGVGALSGSVWKDHPRLDVRELRLIDEQGHPRLLMTLTGNGHPKILMVDSDGLLRAQYTAESLSFEDRGTPRIQLGTGNNLTLFDDSGQRRSELFVDHSGSFLKLNHGPKSAFARMGVSSSGVKFATLSTSATQDAAK